MPSPPPEDVPPSDPGSLEEALVELGRIVLDRPRDEVLQRVVDLASRLLPVADVSVTLLEDGRAVSPVASSAVAAAFDQRQAATGTGPRLDAARDRAVVRTDLSAGGPYPLLQALAREHGVRAVASVGMSTPADVGGSLNLYTRGDGVDEDTVARARLLATYATVAVVHAHLPRRAVPPVARVHEVLRVRAVVEQATGVLMAQLGADAVDATAHLEDLARRGGTSVADVAAGVVDRARRRDRP